jgi:hypothetical protein
MSFLQSLASAFKGGSGKVPLARSFTSPWFVADVGSGQTAYEYNLKIRWRNELCGWLPRGLAGHH